MQISRSFLLSAFVCLLLLFAASSSVVGQITYPPSETISYRDLDGNVLTLRAFSGRHICYALPDSWLEGGGSQGLTPAELITLIDRTDSLYEKMTEVIGAEPRGDGLMIIAIVPLTTGEGGAVGTALIGVKTCEIGVSQLAETKRALSVGSLPDTIIHEMAHNFDVYRNYLGYYLDSPHSWTEFLIPYAQYLLHIGDYGSTPEIALQEKVYGDTARWDARATSSSWEQCVKTGSGCEGITANRA